MLKRLFATALLVSAVAVAPAMAQNAPAEGTPPAKTMNAKPEPHKAMKPVKHKVKHTKPKAHKAMPKKTTPPKTMPKTTAPQ